MFARSSGPILNPSGVSIAPLNPTTKGATDQVVLYFVGFRMLKKLDGGRFEYPVINLNGAPFRVPPLGEGVQVDRVDAEYLVKVTMSMNPNGGDAISGFTYDPMVAASVKAAFEADPSMETFNFGTLAGLAGRENLKTVDDGAVLAEAAARLGISVEQLHGLQAQKDTEKVPPPETVIPAPAAAPPKNRTSTK